MRVSYTAHFQPDGEGGFIVTVPALPGVVTFGQTFEEAKANATEATLCHLEGMIQDGEPVPVESDPIRARLDLEVPTPA
jgi:predicted RNase H-like HicB family nuclease